MRSLWLCALSLCMGGVARAFLTMGGGEENLCHMTYMYFVPQFLEVPLAASVTAEFPHYRLVLYAEADYAQALANDLRPSGIPVLFIPGNAGSDKQVRSLGSVSYLKTRFANGSLPHFNYFAVDLDEELCGLYGGHVERQTRFVAEAVRAIESLYAAGGHERRRLLVVAHSMGGLLVERLVRFGQYDDVGRMVELVVTMAAPHAAPPFAFDATLLRHYADVRRLANASAWRTGAGAVWIPLAAGSHDMMVPAHLTHIDEHYGGVSLWRLLPSLGHVWAAPDHRAIVWCNQLTRLVTRAFFDMLDSSGRLSPSRRRIGQVARFHFGGHSAGLRSIDYHHRTAAALDALLADEDQLGQVALHVDARALLADGCVTVYSMASNESAPDAADFDVHRLAVRLAANTGLVLTTNDTLVLPYFAALQSHGGRFVPLKARFVSAAMRVSLVEPAGDDRRLVVLVLVPRARSPSASKKADACLSDFGPLADGRGAPVADFEPAHGWPLGQSPPSALHIRPAGGVYARSPWPRPDAPVDSVFRSLTLSMPTLDCGDELINETHVHSAAVVLFESAPDARYGVAVHFAPRSERVRHVHWHSVPPAQLAARLRFTMHVWLDARCALGTAGVHVVHNRLKAAALVVQYYAGHAVSMVALHTAAALLAASCAARTAVWLAASVVGCFAGAAALQARFSIFLPSAGASCWRPPDWCLVAVFACSVSTAAYVLAAVGVPLARRLVANACAALGRLPMVRRAPRPPPCNGPTWQVACAAAALLLVAYCRCSAAVLCAVALPSVWAGGGQAGRRMAAMRRVAASLVIMLCSPSLVVWLAAVLRHMSPRLPTDPCTGPLLCLAASAVATAAARRWLAVSPAALAISAHAATFVWTWLHVMQAGRLLAPHYYEPFYENAMLPWPQVAAPFCLVLGHFLATATVPADVAKFKAD